MQGNSSCVLYTFNYNHPDIGDGMNCQLYSDGSKTKLIKFGPSDQVSKTSGYCPKPDIKKDFNPPKPILRHWWGSEREGHFRLCNFPFTFNNKSNYEPILLDNQTMCFVNNQSDTKKEIGIGDLEICRPIKKGKLP